MSEMFHEHRGTVYPLREGAETMFDGIWYHRWLCSGPCSQVVLIRKEDQGVKVRDGKVSGAYGFAVNDKVRDKKTGRRAVVTGFGDVYVWRYVDGRNRRVIAKDEWTIVYRWLEPAKPGGRTIDQAIGIEAKAFIRRFEKQDA